MKKRSVNFNTMINILSSVGVLVTNVCISFLLSPYIIKTIGVEANGFVSLANNFVEYANLIVTALNAMAARFITIAYVNKDYKKANLYYNSVFWGNLIIVAILLIPATVFIIKLELFINIPVELLKDVKILFTIVFFAFFVRTGAPNWDCGAQVTNRLDLTYIPNIVTALIRCILLFCMFSIWHPHVWYVGFVSCVVTLLGLGVGAFNTHKLTPELKISLKERICSFGIIKELVGSGIWSSIAITGNTLLNGIDLLMCNIFLGSTQMGILSLSKSIPSILVTYSESIRGVFGPELTINYAKDDKEQIMRVIQRAMKVSAIVVTIPVAGVVVMSDAFYSLWVPSQDAKLLQVLTILAVLSYLLNSGVIVLYNVFVTVNKVRYNSIAMMITGGLSVIVTFTLIKFTDLDLYAVAGVSSIAMICRDMFFSVPVTSRLLGYRWCQFYPQVGMSLLCSGLIIMVGLSLRLFMPVNTWGSFFVTCCIIGVIGLILNIMIVLNKEERLLLRDIVRKKIKK